jgi:hypothetical protein
MKLSVLEQSSLSEGNSAAEAISNTVALANNKPLHESHGV